MSTNHAHDDRADARTDEALRRELDALAGLGAGASGLDGALASVRSRVRRRRAAKQAGIGATTLAVAAGLAVGGAALLPERPQPLPGPAQTPSPTTSERASSEPTPSESTPSEPTPSGDPTGAPDDDAPEATCSAAGLDPAPPDLSGLTAGARSTAQALLGAALACDADTLVAMSTAEGTSTSFGDRTPQEFWGLPAAEEHADVYAILARLVADASWARTPGAGDVAPATVWPRVATAQFADDDAAWQEAVDVGAVDPELAEDMRAGVGYVGWRLGIEDDGTWRFFIAGD